MAFIVKAKSMENESGMITEQEFIEFMSLQILGVKNERSDNDIRTKRNGQNNKPSQHGSSKNIANPSDTEATPF
jgi:hypothetical protein